MWDLRTHLSGEIQFLLEESLSSIIYLIPDPPLLVVYSQLTGGVCGLGWLITVRNLVSFLFSMDICYFIFFVILDIVH